MQLDMATKSRFERNWHNTLHFVHWCRYGETPQEARMRQVNITHFLFCMLSKHTAYFFVHLQRNLFKPLFWIHFKIEKSFHIQNLLCTYLKVVMTSSTAEVWCIIFWKVYSFCYISALRIFHKQLGTRKGTLSTLK